MVELNKKQRNAIYKAAKQEILNRHYCFLCNRCKSAICTILNVNYKESGKYFECLIELLNKKPKNTEYLWFSDDDVDANKKRMDILEQCIKETN